MSDNLCLVCCRIGCEVGKGTNSLADSLLVLALEQRDKLDRIAESLLERETLETTDLELLMRGDDLPPMRPAASESEASDEGPPESHDVPDGNLPDPEPFPS